MAASVSPTGLTIPTRAEIRAQILDGGDGFLGLRQIYGADINVDPNTPDGNMVELLVQASIDYYELLASVYNSFDPDTAVGTVLDLRCAINGVARLAGTFSTQMVTVVTSQAVTIPGLDTAPDAPFTVSDAAGNRFFLEETTVVGAAGSQDLEFRAEDLGAVIVAANTLTTIVTVQLGVVSVTNGVLSGTTGVDEETDAQLRVRRQNSVEVPSKGYLEGLVGALYAIDGVTSVLVLENVTSSADGDGIPGHSIWVIVNGGTDAAVANAIYVHRNAGCGMKGSVSVNVTQVDGSIFAVLFDRPTPETLWISFNATAITGTVDEAYIRAQLLAQLSYAINQPAVASQITALVESIASNVYLDSVGVGNDGVTYAAIIQNAAKNNQWALIAARVIINGNPG
jgi:uncharacterized phage protein gp47/JayE